MIVINEVLPHGYHEDQLRSIKRMFLHLTFAPWDI